MVLIHYRVYGINGMVQRKGIILEERGQDGAEATHVAAWGLRSTAIDCPQAMRV